MLHYHGTPCGGDKLDAIKLLAGRHALIPFLAQQDVAAAFDVCQSVIFDSSAYTAWRQGAKLDFYAYAAWVKNWYRHPAFDWALIPDKIDGRERENDALLETWQLGAIGVPVWHLHESTKRLNRLCKEWPRVALGSSGAFSQPGSRTWHARMREAMAACCDKEGRPLAKLHGLRMMDPRIFQRYPLASADSSNAARNSMDLTRFGIYPAPTRGHRACVIASRIEQYQSPAVFNA